MVEPRNSTPRSETSVWDLGVRLFHWGLVLAILLAAGTGFLGERNSLNFHLIGGVTVAALVTFRVIWGFSGSTFARFRSFAFGPSAVLTRVREMISGRHTHYLGHNPLGGLMVFALLIVLALIVVTGVVTLGGADKQGPLAFVTSFATGNAFKEIHQILAILLLVLIGGHLAGVAYESKFGKESLVKSMVTGRKRATSDEIPRHPVAARPVIALLAFALIGGGAAFASITLAARPALGVPVGALDPVYVKECGACHFAYPPSLASAKTWVGLLSGLDSHFGEDASLSPATLTHLAAYLSENSAEKWDTRPARLMLATNPADPLRLTSTRFWTRMHHDLPESLFKTKAVGAKGACNACHTDAATGRFDPQNIHVPEEAH